MEIPPNSEVPADAASSSSEKEFVPGYKTVDDFIKVRRCCMGYFLNSKFQKLQRVQLV
jgi:hypothetical protein